MKVELSTDHLTTQLPIFVYVKEVEGLPLGKINQSPFTFKKEGGLYAGQIWFQYPGHYHISIKSGADIFEKDLNVLES